MAVRELRQRPEIFAHFPESEPYRWLELSRVDKTYGYCAFAERSDFVELHLTLVQWGTHVRRQLEKDLDWLKAETKRLGKHKIMGVRANDQGEFDARLFKFAGVFGFTDIHTFQTAAMYLD